VDRGQQPGKPPLKPDTFIRVQQCPITVHCIEKTAVLVIKTMLQPKGKIVFEERITIDVT